MEARTLTGTGRDVYETVPGGGLIENYHPAQWKAMHSPARFVAVIAGAQSGKTVLGPPWLYEEMEKHGEGDYMVVSPSHVLLERKALPTFLEYFDSIMGLGRYASAKHRYVIPPAAASGILRRKAAGPITVYFAHTQNTGTLESATIKAAWLDECGQDGFSVDAWEAVQRRLALFRGRALLTTTPYNFGWLKTRVQDKADAGDRDYQVVNFPSTDNPAFDPEEAERARRDLPPWKYEMFYMGRFTRPAGLIFDTFSSTEHVVSPFPIPDHWPRHVGLDFGGTNTAATFFAAEPNTPNLYLYREYHRGGLTARAHAAAIRAGEAKDFKSVTGGSRSEGQWRAEFRAAGLPVRRPPISDVELGIDRVYGCHTRSEIRVFETCLSYLEQKQTYSRVLDASGEPTPKIADKERFHLMDAERYAIAHLRHVVAEPRRGIRVLR